MSAPPEPPSTNPPPHRPGAFARAARIGGGVVGAWFIMFIAIFFGGATGFEQSHVAWWAWPLVGAAAMLCAGLSWLAPRRQRPETAIGIWIGIGIGRLHAGLCFVGM